MRCQKINGTLKNISVNTKFLVGSNIYVQKIVGMYYVLYLFDRLLDLLLHICPWYLLSTFDDNKIVAEMLNC